MRAVGWDASGVRQGECSANLSRKHRLSHHTPYPTLVFITNKSREGTCRVANQAARIITGAGRGVRHAPPSCGLDVGELRAKIAQRLTTGTPGARNDAFSYVFKEKGPPFDRVRSAVRTGVVHGRVFFGRKCE